MNMPRLVRPNEVRLLDVPGMPTRLLILSVDTGGHFALLEHTLEPNVLAAPMHTHKREDEYVWVLEGELTVQVGSDIATASAGMLIFKPRDVPHTMWNKGGVPVRFLEMISPSGFEEFYEEFAQPPNPDFNEQEQDEELIRLGRRYEVRFDMNSTAELQERHGIHL
jgi:uncharacterized cupin superfamily protein